MRYLGGVGRAATRAGDLGRLRGAGREFVVGAGGGAIALSEIQLEGKRPATAREFLAGHRVASGDRFHTGP